ncbi:uncharacterized protein [Aegilops tauschii subsp. strangulata]|uniref:uncharacterized protein isoform X3 n=1 Tax=Aegilops tauschii subsp. strangulata TaxID=200361 RepID=UPI003CC8BEE3
MGEATATATAEAEAPVSSWVVEMEKTIGEMHIDPAAEMARWKRHSIYRVPERIKNLHNSKAYQPELVSLGPFHHGDPELLPMEEHKRRAVVHLVKRSGRPLREFVAAVAEVAQQLQDAYKDLGDEWRGAAGGGTDRFVQLMVTDGCFLVEAMRMDALRGKVHEEYAPNDPVFSKYGYLYLWNYIQSDMVVVENQLPLLLLQRLLIVLDHHKYQVTMPRKRKLDDDFEEVNPLKKHKPPADRNRASPSALVTACKDMSDETMAAIDDMDFTSLRNIKCDNLFNRLSQWLAGLYDPDSREVVVPGRGRLPVSEESVHRIMGVPRGDIAVDFKVPTDAQLELAGDLFGDLGHAPKTVDVLNLILSTNRHDDNFKRLWLVLAASIVMAPTTSNKISTRWYPVLMSEPRSQMPPSMLTTTWRPPTTRSS